MTVAEAGELWVKACEVDELERATIDAYRQHLLLHICPYLGGYKLSQLTVPLVRKFKDDLRADNRSPAMVKLVRQAHKLICPPHRRFPPPWSVEERPACFIVRDHNGRPKCCGHSVSEASSAFSYFLLGTRWYGE